MRLVGYIRVSTTEQAEEGVSLASQLARIRAAMPVFGHELVEVYEDRGKSGKDMKRLGLKAALEALASGAADGLIVTHLDRLSRSLQDVLYLVEQYFGPGRGHELVCLDNQVDTSNPTGRMMMSLLAVIAQWQREESLERIRQAMAHRKAQGKRTGSVPWGYRLLGDGETLAPHPGEREMLLFALAERRAGKTLRTVAEALKLRGYRNRRGSRNWNPGSVRSVIRAAEEYERSEAKQWEDEERAMAAELAAGLLDATDAGSGG